MRPKIFISSVSSELRSARQKVANAVEHLGFEPVWQDEFPTDAGTVRSVLEEKISQCEGLIQLVGSTYGFEPRVPIGEFPLFDRISYTQFEYLYAQKKGIKTWLIKVGEAVQRELPVEELDLPPSPDHPDPKGYQHDRFCLQKRYKEAVLGGDALFHSVANDEALVSVSAKIPPAFTDLIESYRRKLRFITGGTIGALVLLGVILAVVLGTFDKTSRIADHSEDIRSRTYRVAEDTGEIRETSGRIDETTKRTAEDVQDLQRTVETLTLGQLQEVQSSLVFIDTLLAEAFSWGNLRPGFRINLAVNNAAIETSQEPQRLKTAIDSNSRLAIKDEVLKRKVTAAAQAVRLDVAGLRKTAQELAETEWTALEALGSGPEQEAALLRFLDHQKLALVSLLLEEKGDPTGSVALASDTVRRIEKKGSELAHAAALVFLSNTLSHYGHDTQRVLELLIEARAILAQLRQRGANPQVERTLQGCLMAIARHCVAAGEFEKSLPYARECLEMSQASFGNQHPSTIASKALLGRAVFEVYRTDEEKVVGDDHGSLLKEARDASIGYYGEEHVETARIKYLFWFKCDYWYRRQGAAVGRDKPNDLRVLSVWSGVMRDFLGDHLMLIDPLDDLLAFQFVENRYAEATTTADLMLKILRTNGKRVSKDFVYAMNNKAGALQLTRKFNECFAAHEEAIAAAREMDESEGVVMVAGQLVSYAETLMEVRKQEPELEISRERIEALAQQILTISGNAGSKADYIRGEGEKILAMICRDEEEYPKAEVHARQSLEAFMKDRRFYEQKWDYAAIKAVDLFYEVSSKLDSHSETIVTLNHLATKSGYDAERWNEWITERKLDRK